MRRPFLIVLLSLGVILGYGSAFAHRHHRWHPHAHGCCAHECGGGHGYNPPVATPKPAP